MTLLDEVASESAAAREGGRVIGHAPPHELAHQLDALIRKSLSCFNKDTSSVGASFVLSPKVCNRHVSPQRSREQELTAT